ncbi:hypothetical protein [Pseudomonas nunensis]|uniref:Uncharacterized protein n=1 Tax=Pseudomonas nunensis TaxID=2961896 RepID=A0ABY5EHV2_9PSED|nr:hypothetical protein [Pseudomonas nunensis]MCL5228077.1 hypothetical protein [Pseudomonas nunensis]UTO15039.1 hypothetical protein NK667_01340 [Pseudomonas nunensis]
MIFLNIGQYLFFQYKGLIESSNDAVAKHVAALSAELSMSANDRPMPLESKQVTSDDRVVKRLYDKTEKRTKLRIIDGQL